MRREGPVPSTTTGRACPRNQTDIGDIVAVDRERFMATNGSPNKAVGTLGETERGIVLKCEEEAIRVSLSRWEV